MSQIGTTSAATAELLSPSANSTALVSETATAAPATRIPRPATVQGRVLWLYAIPLLIYHLLGLLAFVPWFFSWTGLLLLAATVPIYGLSMTLVYHRLLAHRSFRVPRWLERGMVLFCQLSIQDTPAKWVAIHRLHHLHPDEQPDPHSPLVSFFWSHVGWLVYHNSGTRTTAIMQKYARDLLEDPFYMRLEKTWLALYLYLGHAVLYFAVGLGVGWFWMGDYWKGLQFGLSILLWGVILRTLYVWHVTWSVNSLTHLFGYRNYPTEENSRNNWLVGIVALGEGWHNNHHSDPPAATVWHRWWEFDATYSFILFLKCLGLATDIIPPKHVRRAAQGRSDEVVPPKATETQSLSA